MTKKSNILAYLKMTDRETPASEIASHLGYAMKSVTGAMSRAFRKGEVTRVWRYENGRYTYFYRLAEKPVVSKREPRRCIAPEKKRGIPLSELCTLMDAPVFAAVRRRQEAVCKA
jgi:hypothetical protein